MGDEPRDKPHHPYREGGKPKKDGAPSPQPKPAENTSWRPGEKGSGRGGIERRLWRQRGRRNGPLGPRAQGITLPCGRPQILLRRYCKCTQHRALLHASSFLKQTARLASRSIVFLSIGCRPAPVSSHSPRGQANSGDIEQKSESAPRGLSTLSLIRRRYPAWGDRAHHERGQREGARKPKVTNSEVMSSSLLRMKSYFRHRNKARS